MTLSRLFPALLLSCALVVPAVPEAIACGDNDEDIPAGMLADAPAEVEDMLATIATTRGSAETDKLIALLGAAKIAGTGAKLIAIADGRFDDGHNDRLYAAAAEIDGEAVFDSLIASLHNGKQTKVSGSIHPAAAGLAVLRERTLAWVDKQLPRSKDPLRLASVVARVAVPADKEFLVTLLDRTRNLTARHRIADVALGLGARSDRLFDTLLASLRSKDAATRADALWYVTAEYIPDQYVKTFRALLENELGKPGRPNLARQLIVLGSTDRRVIDLLFGGLTSSTDSARFGAVLAIPRYVSHLEDSVAQELVNQVDDLLARDQDDRFRRKLEKARDALAAHLAR